MKKAKTCSQCGEVGHTKQSCVKAPQAISNVKRRKTELRAKSSSLTPKLAKVTDVDDGNRESDSDNCSDDDTCKQSNHVDLDDVGNSINVHKSSSEDENDW